MTTHLPPPAPDLDPSPEPQRPLVLLGGEDDVACVDDLCVTPADHAAAAARTPADQATTTADR